MIRGVLFDLGETILKVTNPVTVIESFLEENGILKTPEEISRAVLTAEKSFPEDDFIGPGFWKEWSLRVLTDLGVVSGRERLATIIDSHWFEKAQVEIFPDVIEVLRRLKERNMRIGVVTNGISSDLPHLVGGVGLGEYIDVRASADLAGRRKPSPRIFLYAATHMGLPPSEILFVGDDPELDYYPSEAVGMTPVLVNRERDRPLVKNIIPDLDGIWEFL